MTTSRGEETQMSPNLAFDPAVTLIQKRTSPCDKSDAPSNERYFGVAATCASALREAWLRSRLVLGGECDSAQPDVSSQGCDQEPPAAL